MNKSIDKSIPATVSANGMPLPALGQGGWHIGEDPKKAQNEIDALRLGLDLGINLIDTAEMYGDGKSEELIGKALSGRHREEYLLVSKVYPYHAGREDIFKSCDATLKRLKTDYLDLYLLHWRGSIPLSETVECMEKLVQSGKIRRWGVSNFDTSDMEELWSLPGGRNCAVNQVLYNLGSRGIEYDLIPWLTSHHVAAMAYCPLAQAGTLRRTHRNLLRDPVLSGVAEKYRISIMQLLLAFVLRQDNMVAIPKAGSPAHVRQNAEVLRLSIAEEDWKEINKAFGPPTGKTPLDME